jgi:hypothetical protein
MQELGSGTQLHFDVYWMKDEALPTACLVGGFALGTQLS